MALRLQFLTVVVPRSAFSRCRDLPAWFQQLPTTGGYGLDTEWFDSHLWCETAMDEPAAEDLLRAWESRGLHRHSMDGQWEDFCLAASGRGPLGPCPWLGYAPDTNSVWSAGAEPGEIIGGQAHRLALEEERVEAEAAGEAAYDLMYVARRPKDAYEDACAALGRARSLARFLNHPDDGARLAARIEHIQAVYNAQFRGW